MQVVKVPLVTEKPTKLSAVAKCPEGCIHEARWDEGTTFCAYILDEGHRRPCPAGMNCTEYKRGERDRRRSPELWED